MNKMENNARVEIIVTGRQEEESRINYTLNKRSFIKYTICYRRMYALLTLLLLSYVLIDCLAVVSFVVLILLIF